MKLALVSDAWRPQINGVVRTLETTVGKLRARGWTVETITPDLFRNIPCPSYPEIRLAIGAGREVARRLAGFGADAVHIATEGPLGWAARRWCLDQGMSFTTSFHTRFPDYVALRTGLPPSWFWPVVRRFHAPATRIMATTRMRDTAFKRVLRDLPLGTELELDAPYGLFTLNTITRRPAVFLTGGIGITPVRSMILQSVHDDDGPEIRLFYSNRRPAEAPFLEELTRVADASPKVTLVATMTAPESTDEGWHDETGHITAAMLSRHLGDLGSPIFYLCGPVDMVNPMKIALVAAGIDENDIRTEEFEGY